MLDRSLARMNLLVSETLVASLLDAGAPANIRRMPVSALLAELEAVATPERGIRFRADVEPSAEIDCDLRLLVSAVGNLLHNAFKFTRPEGDVVLRARSDADRVVLEVEDECGGLGPGTETTLFDAFQRGNDERSVGFRLAIVRDAVRAQHGEVSVENRAPRGCAFRLSLPRGGTST